MGTGTSPIQSFLNYILSRYLKCIAPKIFEDAKINKKIIILVRSFMSTCPCSSNRAYDDCCAPIIAGSPAPTAEALVRSRYTAFVVKA